jgi:hypothetical protein
MRQRLEFLSPLHILKILAYITLLYPIYRASLGHLNTNEAV